MPNDLKNNGFSIAWPRLFTRGHYDAYDLIHFRQPEASGDEIAPALECPDNWSREAAALLADEAAHKAVPARRKAIEENTVPSWLWRHAAEGKPVSEETGVQHIFDRVAGSAAYTGWKLGLFADENVARAFFDEARYALAQRFIAIEPRRLASPGLDWAYGFEKPEAAPPSGTHLPAAEIGNAMIDAIVSGKADKTLRAKWQKIIKTGASPALLRFADIASDWNTQDAPAMIAALDLMAFRHNDGSINIDALRHATRLLTVLLDLHDATDGNLALGFQNLAPLLMAFALPYDSDAARATAAAISAIVAAEAYATSAELAGLRGASAAFAARRDAVMRSLRNHCRTAYGDRNDYEKLSVLPAPLMLEQCHDLALVAAARRRWDEALNLARQHGLRHIQATTLLASPELTLFMESAAQGIAPLRTLAADRQTEADVFAREIHPSVTEALTRLGYSRADSNGIIAHIAGTRTLAKAPVINHAALRAKGFDDAALGRIEDYLPYAGSLRVAFTPWIAGEAFCRGILKIPAAKLQNPHFDLLRHLGFSDADIAAADAFCYGHGSAKGAKQLRQAHAAVFACGGEIAPEARIRMAAAVQGFISGNTGLDLSLPVNMPAEKTEKLLLGAWRQGVKSLTIDYDADAAPVIERKQKPDGRLATFLHTQSPSLPARRGKNRAGSRLVSLRPAAPKHFAKNKGK